MKKKDYYAILGVDRNADDAAIKKAFRQLAKKYHPDTNGGNRDAEERFKEINEAYHVLSNKEKRAEYDAPEPDYSGFGYGDAGGRGFSYSAGNAADFEDLFGSFFRGGGQGGARVYRTYTTRGFDDVWSDAGTDSGREYRGYETPQPRRGDDIEKELKITLEEAESGCEKNCKVTRMNVCPRCGGLGTAGGGTCPECGGKGQVRATTQRKLKIPAGVSDGQILKIRGQGKAGKNGGENGDMKITIRLKPHNRFTRKDNDLYTRVTITVPQAVLGCEAEVKTPGGSFVYSFPAGTQPEQMFRVPGRGARNLAGERGDLYVTVGVEIPKKLTAKQKALYEELNNTGKKKKACA